MKKDSDIYSLQKELNQVNKDLSGKSNYVFTLFVLLLLVMGAGSIASEPSITGAAVSDITGMSFLDITGKTLLDIAGWGFLEFFRDSSTSSNEENLDEISDSSAYKRGEEIKKPDSMKEEKSAGSIGIPELSTTIKKEKSKPNKGSKDISFVLETDENKDVQKNKQKGKKNVKVKHNNGKAIAKLEIDFDSNDELNFSQVVAQIDFSSNKAVLHADNWTTSVTRRSLYVPSSGKGEVFICPGAVSLEEVNPSCPGYFEISVGEFKNGVYLSEELINGDHYYLATGISGTGAGEITTISLVSLDAGGANENLSLSYTVSETGLRNITDWRLHNGSQFNSIAVLNLPFEGGSNSTFTKDYSTYSNNGTVSGATFNSTGGFNGFGAYEFDGASDYIKITDDASFDFTANENFTIIVWAKFPLQANDFNMLYSKVKSTADFDGYFLYYENRDVISDISNLILAQQMHFCIQIKV